VEKEKADVLAAPRGILIQDAIATGTDVVPRFNSVLNRVGPPVGDDRDINVPARTQRERNVLKTEIA
jgi:hypothetical protein